MVRKIAITQAIVLLVISAAAATIEKRVVNGEDAKTGELPFMVLLQASNTICGGTLLDSTTVLTAAHCVPGSLSARAGSLDPKAGGVDVKIASGIQHPDYDSKKGDAEQVNDIGIIKLATPIEKSQTIGYATLPAEGSDPVPDSNAIAAGWGNQTPGPLDEQLRVKVAKTLRKATLTVRQREYCVSLHESVQPRDTIVCAGGEGPTVCSGDSGGPLVDEKTGQVIGIASFSFPDSTDTHCSDRLPAVFTRVSSYISFINEHLGGSSSIPNRTMSQVT